MALVMRWMIALVLFTACDDVRVPAATRNKTLWPFAATSIWNMPVGSGARYVPAGIKAVQTSVLSASYLVTTQPTDPLRSLVTPTDLPERCGGTEVRDMIRFPDAFILPSERNGDPGNSLAILQPDGHGLVEISGFARCVAAGPVTGFRFPDSDLLGDGRLGGQGGSGLSSVGGALVPGELWNGLPVRHALKVALSSDLYYFADPAQPDSCFRWPADRCDGGFANADEGGYHGTNTELTMGSLLAIPLEISENALTFETAAGRAMFFTLQNYGAYVVGSAGTDWALWGARAEAQSPFFAALGPNGRDAWARDVNRLLPLLSVVANNSPQAVGGGGTPRQAFAPPLAD